MDPTLQALLENTRLRDEPAPDAPERVDILHTLADEIARLEDLSDDEWEAKLGHAEGDVEVLATEAARARERAAAAARRHERANQQLETLWGLRDKASERDAARTGSTRDMVLKVLREGSNVTWSAQSLHDELRRRGYPSTRANVHSALRRLWTEEKLVRKVGRGLYEFNPEVVDGGWFTDALLDQVASLAADRCLEAHPSAGDRDELVMEAKRRVKVWIDGHGELPDGEGHLRRLMKTALDDYRRRANGSRETASEGR